MLKSGSQRSILNQNISKYLGTKLGADHQREFISYNRFCMLARRKALALYDTVHCYTFVGRFGRSDRY